MQVAVGEDDEAAVLGLGVFAGLLLADERILALRFGLEDKKRETFRIEQQEVDKALGRLLKIVAKRVKVGRFDRHAGFKADVLGRVPLREKTPICGLKELVDLDAGCGFFVGHRTPILLILIERRYIRPILGKVYRQ